jgi:hypothetical protein
MFLRTSNGTILKEITAFDALVLRDMNPLVQFQPDLFKRELVKAFIAFQQLQSSSDPITRSVATGNWGCGGKRTDLFVKMF